MKQYEICYKLLKDLDENIRIWGSVVDKFLLNYKQLTFKEREKLAAEIPKAVRFDLMNQYLEHFGRVYDKNTPDDLKTLIENSIYLISLDNFEDDYRETNVRVQKFLERIQSQTMLFQSIWFCLSDQIPERTIKEINRLTDLISDFSAT